MVSAESRPDFARQRILVRDGTLRLVEAVRLLGAHEWSEPSALPGWSRAHVVAHLARNADALVNLATWARTGIPTPMYPNMSERAKDIDRTVLNEPDLIRSDFERSGETLDSAIENLSTRDWERRVETAMGRNVAATEILWLRIREVWIHANDLGIGVSLMDAPADLLRSLLAEAVAMLSTRDECPNLELRVACNDAGDQNQAWLLGRPGSSPVVVTGSLFGLVTWVLGRSPGHELHCSQRRDLPPLPRWL